METIIITAMAFALGWFLGAFVTAVKQAQAFKSILNDLGVTSEQLLKLKDRMDHEDEPQTVSRETVVEVTLEKMGNMIYAYRKDNSQFLGQGTDRDALIQHLNHTFANGARLIIREQDGAELVK
jgi:hypothetical protein